MQALTPSTDLTSCFSNSSNKCPKSSKVTLMIKGMAFVCFVTCVAAAWSQDLLTLNQDWTKTDAAEKSKDFGEIDPGSYTYKLIGVNSFYYTYTTAITEQDISQSAFNMILPFIKGAAGFQAAGPGPLTCDDKAKLVFKDIDAMTKKFKLDAPDAKGQYPSVSYAATQAEWNVSIDTHYNDFTTDTTCQTGATADQYKKLKEAHDRLFPGTVIPTVTASIPVKACKTYTVAVSEFHEGVSTAESRSAKFSATCDILTFSAGPMFTKIQNPTYNSRPNPNGAGQVLSVENGGLFRPTVAALFNYNWPAFAKTGIFEPLRLGISTGPVFQTSQNSASAFGWFAGGSVSVYKYLVLSAGEHFGQFAGPPYGLSNGQPIPPNYGNLTPTLRYTARFAFGITFRTRDISKVFSGGTQTPSVSAKPSK